MEIWKDVEGYEGIYQVSNLGHIKRRPRRSWRFGRWIMLPERLLNPSQCKKMLYKSFSAIDANGKKTQVMVHRLVAATFCPGKSEDRYCVNHINAVRTDNRAENLEWCTPQENSEHAVSMGLLKPCKGVDNSQAKLSEENILEIKSRYTKYSKGPNSGVALAKEFGVSNVTIHNIINNKAWCHV